MIKRKPEWWFLMGFATALFGLIGWIVLKDLFYEHVFLFIVFYSLFVVLGDGLTALAAEKIAPTHIHIGPGERSSKHHLTTETAVAASNFDDEGRGRVMVRSEIWRAELANDEDQISKQDTLRIVGRDGLTLLVRRADS